MKTQSVQLLDKTLTVRELTIAEQREWLTSKTLDQSDDPVDALIIEGVHLQDLAVCCGVTVEEFDGATPSALADLVQAARELNPGLFKLRQAMQMAAQGMLAATRVGGDRVLQ